MRKRITNDLEGEISIDLRGLKPKAFAKCRVSNKHVELGDFIQLYMNTLDSPLRPCVAYIGSGVWEMWHRNDGTEPISGKQITKFIIQKGHML